jgi:transcription initiation factor TFIIH subunit 1
MPTTVCTAKASCKKLPGLLELTDTHLQWTQDGKKAPSIRVAYAEASCQLVLCPALFFVVLISGSPTNAALFCSKEGAAQVRLKLSLLGDDAGHNFTFTSPQPLAFTEREKFKQELTSIISRNRSASELLPRPHVPPVNATSSTPFSSAPSPANLNAKSAPSSTRPPVSRAASVASDRRETPVITGGDPASEFRLRKKVLLSSPELGALHRDLVMSGQITEAEFWDGREVRYGKNHVSFWLTYI